MTIWNSSDTSGGVTFSNGNLTVKATNNSWWYSTRATIGKSTGKWYWEVAVTGATTMNLITGIAKSTVTFDMGTGFCTSVDGLGYYTNGNKLTNNVQAAYGSTYTTGDIIGIALDLGAGTLIFYKNGTTQGTAFTGLSGTYYPAITMGPESVVNFGASTFAYSIPSGYERYTVPLLFSLQRIPHDTTKYSNNSVELINIANRKRIGKTAIYNNYIGI